VLVSTGHLTFPYSPVCDIGCDAVVSLPLDVVILEKLPSRHHSRVAKYPGSLVHNTPRATDEKVGDDGADASNR
jgi:hypothetical protein